MVSKWGESRLKLMCVKFLGTKLAKWLKEMKLLMKEVEYTVDLE